MLQIITFALFLGMGATSLADGKGKPFIEFFESLAEIMYKITGSVMELAPIGVFGLITPVVASNGSAVLMPLIKVVAAVYIGCVIHSMLIYSSTIKLFAGMSPMKFFRGIMPAAVIVAASENEMEIQAEETTRDGETVRI
jgi:Na+/H+-dicarboxylate symporter